ncbi:hypothetical protein Hanom_Chr04g00348451 [Helianthus anomalus]
MNTFQTFSIKKVPRSQNKRTNALSKLVSPTFAHLTKKVLIEVLKTSSIQRLEVQHVITKKRPNWMTPIERFLKMVNYLMTRLRLKGFVSSQGNMCYKEISFTKKIPCTTTSMRWPRTKPISDYRGS